MDELQGKEPLGADRGMAPQPQSIEPPLDSFRSLCLFFG